jgi:hypothetical protein
MAIYGSAFLSTLTVGPFAGPVVRPCSCLSNGCACHHAKAGQLHAADDCRMDRVGNS